MALVLKMAVVPNSLGTGTGGAGGRGASGKRQTGFSFVEALISMLLILVVSLSVVAMYTRSLTSNFAGREATDVSNAARTRAEEFVQLPFNSEPLTIEDGVEKQHFEVFRDGAWEAVPSLDLPLPAGTEKTRTTTVQQYGVSDLATPLAAGADGQKVHVKEIVVVVWVPRFGGAFGMGQRVAVRMYKTF